MTRTHAIVAAICAAVCAMFTVLICGLAAMIRQYRELTVPLGLLLGLGTLVLGFIAFRGFLAPPDPPRQPPA